MQELSLHRHLSPEKIRPEEMPRSPNISPNLTSNLASVCERQVAELVGQLPLLGAWIVCRTRSHPLGKRHRFRVVCEERPGFDPTIVSELESEVWRDGEGDIQAEKALNNINIYFYPLFSRGCSELAISAPRSSSTANLSVHLSDGKLPSPAKDLDEYLLLWAALPLSSSQQQTIEQRVQLLKDYLIMGRDCSRQQEEIHLLEQAIGRAEHQLRNYLANIGIYAQNINLGADDSSLKEQAKVIRDTVREMSANLNQLLICGQPKKNKFIKQNFSLIIEGILQVLTPNICKKNIQIEQSQNILNFEGDFWQIKQVFENLLSNAIEFSPWGGLVTCQWQGFPNEVLIKISDRGPGFSAEDLQNAFTPYYSKRPGGTGLGLAIAKKIILDHKGSIWLENLPEGGAQVSVILPRYAQ